MKAAPYGTFESGRLTTGFATAEPVDGPRGHLARDHRAANSGEFRAWYTRHVESVVTQIERVVVLARHGLRDARERRRAERELLRLSPALLADIGIEPEEIDQVVEAVFASRRNLV